MRKTLPIRTFIVGTSLLSSSLVTAQNVGVNATGAAPDASAMLDIVSANRGLLVPRVALTATTNAVGPIAAPTTSLLVYNTASVSDVTPGYYYWDGAAWVRFQASNTIDDWKLLGNAGTVAGTNFVGTTDNIALQFRTNNLQRFEVSSGDATTGGRLRAFNNGTAATPVYSWNGDNNMGIYRIGNDDLGISTGGVERVSIANGATIFNETGTNTDFRVESDAQNDMFFVDASTNRIGINTLTPANVIDFRTTGEAIWLTYFENSHAANGAAGQFNHTNTANGNRVLMGITNYNGSAQSAAAVMGLSLNNTTTGSGGIGIQGSANNESGIAVYGNLFTTGAYNGWAGYFDKDVYCAATYFGSDRRLKRDIKPITKALDLINQVKPVSYMYDTEKYPHIGLDENQLTFGFIAQELETVFPEMVRDKLLVTNSTLPKTTDMQQVVEKESFKVVNYTLMIPILTQAIKEQQAIIEDLLKRIELLELELKNK